MEDDSKTAVCPSCGRELPAPIESCPDCAAPQSSPSKKPKPKPTSADQRAGATFSLTSLMAMITILALSLGIGMAFPPLGIGIFLVFTPAYIRTSLMLRRLREAGLEFHFTSEHMAFFLASAGVFIASYAAAGAAFYGMCWAGFWAGAMASEVGGAKGFDPIGYGLITGIIVGGISGIALLVWIGRKWWSAKKWAQWYLQKM